MRICITSQGKKLTSFVDPRFGRCQYFVFLNEKGKVEKVIENPGIFASRGAGISAAQTIVSEGADVLITGNIGPNAFSVLNQNGVKIFFSPVTTIKNAFLMWKENKLTQANAPTMKGGFGGRGRGVGRSLGRRSFKRGLGRFFRRI